MLLNENLAEQVIKRALEEDLGKEKDLTTEAVLPEDKMVEAVILSKDEGVLAGAYIAARVFTMLDSSMEVSQQVAEGEAIKSGQALIKLKGSIKAVLGAERVALNFLQHLSGIATLTAKFVQKARKWGVIILDTRKTLPNLRALEKYAVKVGGGENHRLGLYDGILIKDNHIEVAGSITKAVANARGNLPLAAKIEVEAESLAQVKDALEAKVDIIMLDNFDLPTIKEAVELIKGKAVVEVSGRVNLENVEEITKAGVDQISIGALTQAAPPLDMSLKIITEEL